MRHGVRLRICSVLHERRLLSKWQGSLTPIARNPYNRGEFTMHVSAQPREQEKRIPTVIESDEDLKKFQQHLKEIVEGPAFRGSQRSAQFLTYVVEQAIAGQWNALKERTIGIELFGRSPTYDTGEDAIVRVTASDVRKRLLQHYGRHGAASEFRVSLPAGHYIPEIVREPRSVAENVAVATNAAVPNLVHAEPEVGAVPVAAEATRHVSWWWFLSFALLLCAANLAAWFIVIRQHDPHQPDTKPADVLPWAAMLHSTRTTMLVTSDPNIAEIQGLTGEPTSTSDYANQVYVPTRSLLSPNTLNFAREILRGDKAANVDVAVVAKIAELAQETGGGRLIVRGARDLRLDELDTENNFVFIGSPLTDPWTTLFNDQLDFRFVYNKSTRGEFIENVRPQAGEAATYIPTAKGFATGDSFATVSFVGNPNHSGQILLLAGLNAEGTKASGELVADLASLPKVLDGCGIRSATKVQHFQLLLRLSTMAGSPRHWDVVACHVLS